MRHLGIINVSAELLAEILHFPDGASIVGIRENFDCFSSGGPVLQIKVEHKDLPAVGEGYEIKIMNPKWHTTADGRTQLESWE